MEQSTKDRKQRCDRSNQDTVKEVIFQMYYTQRLSLPYGLVTLELTTASFMGSIYNNIYISGALKNSVPHITINRRKNVF